MRARRVHVHVGGRNRSVLLPHRQETVDVLCSSYRLQRETRHKVPLLALPYLKLCPLLVWTDEQVADLLVIDLDESAFQLHLPAHPLLGDFEELVEGAHVNAWIIFGALHRVSLAGPSLSVREDANAEPIHHRHDQVADACKHHCLRGVLLEHLVELICLLASRGLIADLYLVSGGEGDTATRFVSGQRADAAVNADVALQLLHQVVQLAPPRAL
mmetsp:Transcript_12084/g.34182  ORF Transcript_12084/g.34182 Transcript_12084/m.34182 type:complete len:215 (+) Transcript_12084:209-853(+)